MTNFIPNVVQGNSMTINGVSSELAPEGAYSICNYVDAFNEKLETLQARPLYAQNRMEFRNTSDTEATIALSQDLQGLFGFATESIIVPANGTLVSPELLVPQRITELVLAIDGVIPGPPQNIANLGQDSMVHTDVIGIVPLLAPPKTVNVYTNDHHAFECHLFDGDVQTLGLRVMDSNRKQITGLPHWSVVLRADVVRKPDDGPVVERLDRILRYLELYTLMLATERAENGQSLPSRGSDAGIDLVMPVYAGNRVV
jgi:hypothetical protein